MPKMRPTKKIKIRFNRSSVQPVDHRSIKGKTYQPPEKAKRKKKSKRLPKRT